METKLYVAGERAFLPVSTFATFACLRGPAAGQSGPNFAQTAGNGPGTLRACQSCALRLGPAKVVHRPKSPRPITRPLRKTLLKTGFGVVFECPVNNSNPLMVCLLAISLCSRL